MGFSAAASGNFIQSRNNSRFGVLGFRATAFRIASSEERAALANQSGGVRQSLAISRSEEAATETGGTPRDAESVEDGSTDSMGEAEFCGIIGEQPTPTRGAYPATGSFFSPDSEFRAQCLSITPKSLIADSFYYQIPVFLQSFKVLVFRQCFHSMAKCT